MPYYHQCTTDHPRSLDWAGHIIERVQTMKSKQSYHSTNRAPNTHMNITSNHFSASYKSSKSTATKQKKMNKEPQQTTTEIKQIIEKISNNPNIRKISNKKLMFQCSLCNVIGNVFKMKHHLDGYWHLSKELMQNPTIQKTNNVNADKEYKCALCDIFGSAQSMKDHLITTNHIKNEQIHCKLAKERQRSYFEKKQKELQQEKEELLRQIALMEGKKKKKKMKNPKKRTLDEICPNEEIKSPNRKRRKLNNDSIKTESEKTINWEWKVGDKCGIYLDNKPKLIKWFNDGKVVKIEKNENCEWLMIEYDEKRRNIKVKADDLWITRLIDLKKK